MWAKENIYEYDANYHFLVLKFNLRLHAFLALLPEPLLGIKDKNCGAEKEKYNQIDFVFLNRS